MKNLATIALVLLIPLTSAFAQYSTQGFFANLHGSSVAWTLDEGDGSDTDAESGFGGGLTIGYGFSDVLSAFATFNGASISPDEDDGESYTLGHADIGARATFGSPTSAFKFFGQAAVAGRVASLDDSFMGTVTISGAGFSMGGGVEYHFNDSVALEIGGIYMLGSISKVEIDDVEIDISDQDISATSLRLNAGISFYPGR